MEQEIVGAGMPAKSSLKLIGKNGDRLCSIRGRILTSVVSFDTTEENMRPGTLTFQMICH